MYSFIISSLLLHILKNGGEAPPFWFILISVRAGQFRALFELKTSSCTHSFALGSCVMFVTPIYSSLSDSGLDFEPSAKFYSSGGRLLPSDLAVALGLGFDLVDSVIALFAFFNSSFKNSISACIAPICSP